MMPNVNSRRSRGAPQNIPCASVGLRNNLARHIPKRASKRFHFHRGSRVGAMSFTAILRRYVPGFNPAPKKSTGT